MLKTRQELLAAIDEDQTFFEFSGGGHIGFHEESNDRMLFLSITSAVHFVHSRLCGARAKSDDCADDNLSARIALLESYQKELRERGRNLDFGANWEDRDYEVVNSELLERLDPRSALEVAFILGGTNGSSETVKRLQRFKAMRHFDHSDMKCIDALDRANGNVTQAAKLLDPPLTPKRMSQRVGEIAKRYKTTRDIVKGTSSKQHL